MNEIIRNHLLSLYQFRENNRGMQHVETLVQNFESMEQLWEENLTEMTSIRFVIIGEAPLWGITQNYIYNPQTEPTLFFNSNHANQIWDITLAPDNKLELLNVLRDQGVLFVDAFPCTLNQEVELKFRRRRNDVPRTYLSGREYRQLAHLSFQHYLAPKLERILNDNRTDNAHLLFRYRAVQRPFCDLVTDGFGDRIEVNPIHLGRVNGHLNTEILQEYLN